VEIKRNKIIKYIKKWRLNDFENINRTPQNGEFVKKEKKLGKMLAFFFVL